MVWNLNSNTFSVADNLMYHACSSNNLWQFNFIFNFKLCNIFIHFGIYIFKSFTLIYLIACTHIQTHTHIHTHTQTSPKHVPNFVELDKEFDLVKEGNCS